MRKTIFLFSIILLTSCNFSSSEIENRIDEDIKLHKKVDFTNLNSFEWDKLLILTPYSNVDIVEKRYKINLSTVSKTIESDDNINTIVFLSKNRAVKYVELSRKYGDFSNINGIIEKNDAIFKYEKTPTWQYLNLINK
jgi:cell division protein FtsX